MRLFPLVPISAALLAAGVTAPAAAADYEPPLVIEDVPEYVPVEVGSGWYLRGDLSYNLNTPVYDFSLAGEEADNHRFGGGVGFGYHFTDMLRADVNVAYVGRDTFDDGVSTAENRVIGAFANAYLDLGTFVGITPYVGAGAGLLYSKYEVDVPAITASDRQYKFAYTLNAGLAYRVTKNVSVDVGYQYLASPGTEYADVSAGTIEKGVHYHQIRVGLRYDLW